MAPREKVSRARYLVGLIMFVIPLLLGWATPYFGGYLPGFHQHPLVYAAIGDALLLVSLYLLGGEFWDKLRSLFVYSARAVFPDPRSTDESH